MSCPYNSTAFTQASADWDFQVLTIDPGREANVPRFKPWAVFDFRSAFCFHRLLNTQSDLLSRPHLSEKKNGRLERRPLDSGNQASLVPVDEEGMLGNCFLGRMGMKRKYGSMRHSRGNHGGLQEVRTEVESGAMEVEMVDDQGSGTNTSEENSDDPDDCDCDCLCHLNCDPDSDGNCYCGTDSEIDDDDDGDEEEFS